VGRLRYYWKNGGCNIIVTAVVQPAIVVEDVYDVDSAKSEAAAIGSNCQLS
jgi:hypothetical protein